jgi:OOP family OmpA-OmpF porin
MLIRLDGNKLKMPGAITFEKNKAVLTPESEPTLEQLRTYMVQNPTTTLLRIEGHTDNVGDAAANLKLSGERAEAVKTWLTSHSIESKRLIAVGFGSNKPIADNRTEEGRAQNRRTEFMVVEMNGKPYQNQDATGGGTVFGENPRP